MQREVLTPELLIEKIKNIIFQNKLTFGKLWSMPRPAFELLPPSTFVNGANWDAKIPSGLPPEMETAFREAIDATQKLFDLPIERSGACFA